MNNKTITLTGNPNKILDFVHVDDVIKANIRALKIKSSFEILHVTAGEPITLIDLTNRVIEMCGKKGHSVIINEKAVVPAEPLINYLDDNYSRKLLKTTETIGVNQMIEETFNEIKKVMDDCQ
jgi:nucleoside-diphosphate-sugar epimerase